MSRTKEQKADLLERYERASELPLALLALLLVPLLVVPLIADLSERLDSTFFAVDLFIRGVFVVDLAPHVYLAPAKFGYLRSNWLDVFLLTLTFAVSAAACDTSGSTPECRD